MIGISDSSLKRIIKDLNMKSFYRHEVPVNKNKSDLLINKQNKKGNKKLSSKRGFVYLKDETGAGKATITNYDILISDKTYSLFNNKPKKVLSEMALKRVKDISERELTTAK